jgi:hypothetical protein
METSVEYYNYSWEQMYREANGNYEATASLYREAMKRVRELEQEVKRLEAELRNPWITFNKGHRDK